MTLDVAKLERGLLVSGKYRLSAPLDAGGMGAVWVAHHEDLDVDVALKFVLRDASDGGDGLARFKREARAAARLKSPHTTQILDYGIDGELPYIAMELLEGHHLGVELRQQGALPPERVAKIAMQVAKGLGEAHDAGIIHRDVKPGNIFLAQVAGEELVKVLDFGIAKVTDVEQTGEHITTKTGTFLGSPRYMSPEQASGDPVDHRSDLFSLGAVVFEMLAGRRLFTSQHLGELVLQVTKAKVPVLETVRAGLPPQLDAFFRRALAANPELRFADAGAFARALEAACAGREMPDEIVDEETADTAGSPIDARGREPAVASAPDPHAETTTTVVRDAETRAPRRTGRWGLVGLLVIAGAAGAFWLTRPSQEGRDVATPASSSTPPSSPVLPSTAPASSGVSATSAPSASTAATASAAPSASTPRIPVQRPIRPRVVPPRAPAPPRPPPKPNPGDGIFDPQPR